MPYIVTVEDKTFKVDLERQDNKFIVYLNSNPVEVTAAEAGNPSHLSLIVGNKSYDVTIENKNIISVNGEAFQVKIEDERVQQLARLRGKIVRIEEVYIAAPMPGLVVEVEVGVGDRVKVGSGLIVIEAMKMQNELKAPREGVVKEVLVKKGMSVNGGDTLVVIG
jgi:biotin carboxyl carrier protein